MKQIRYLWMLLCLALLLALPAGALEFTDESLMKNPNEVTMLIDLGIVSGYSDGTFRPTALVTRAEAAKIMTTLCTDAPIEGGSSGFLDAGGHWAEPYIAYCTQAGIINGYDDGTFRPEGLVTAREMAKLLLGVIGYDASRYQGAGWDAQVDTDARSLGLYDGYYHDPSLPLSREGACVMIYNALGCSKIESQAGGQTVYVLDALMNPKTLLEVRFGAVRYNEVLVANEYADLTQSSSHLPQGQTELSNHMQPFAVSTGRELLGRYVVMYVVDGEVVGVPCYSADEVYYTFDSVADFRSALELTGYRTGEQTAYYYNYNRAEAACLDALSGEVSVTVIDHTDDGVLDLVLIEEYRPATVVSAEPLTVSNGIQSFTPSHTALAKAPEVGQTVLAACIGGEWYVQ